MFNSLEFADPHFFVLLILVPVILFWRKMKLAKSAVVYSNVQIIRAVKPSLRQRTQPVLHWLQILILVLLIIAMARPRTRNSQSSVTSEGIDIMMALDVSRSMLIEDMGNLNRMDAAKDVAEQFVRGRQSDRVGLVIFAGKSFTQCPLTVDYQILTSLIRQVSIGMVEDGTAIGMGLINSINRLRESKSKSKVIILLTDGQNNRGEIDPLTAAQIAQALNIRVYTIGAGKDGLARIPVDDPFFGKQYVTAEVKIDEETLKGIAEITGGQYFRATNLKALEEIYEQIGQLEKTKIDVKTYFRYEDLYPWVLIPALFLLFLHFVLIRSIFLKLP
ncbi:VWA domain-containing protein [bacterium]|nr:VWA domain-containing protein [bacterium]